ncbi:50kDa lectin [Operophtera brumata]|uniref:50kDa lectin n=1 Tax=Operophtera brumata TaxID=104452 RepID=A0A0L7LJY4_OPEBR|nr:50kDa lectin [Operophtera brumata]
MATRLFVGNLPENTAESDLRSAFSSYGEITTLDLKTKTANGNEIKKFAFVSLSGSNYNIEACIKHFTNEDFNGSRLYVTRARESFLERLQREREQAQIKKRSERTFPIEKPEIKKAETVPFTEYNESAKHTDNSKPFNNVTLPMQNGDGGDDKVQNKKIVFSDNEDDTPQSTGNAKQKQKKNTKSKGILFDDEDSGDDVDFAIKEQFEGKKGQKVLDLQSRYKSDKRFTLDERFVEAENSEEEQGEAVENVELEQKDEKNKQLDILQDVLGITLKRRVLLDDNTRNKPKLGMLRFDPSQPEHARFLAPVEPKKQEPNKKGKKKLLAEKSEEHRPEEVRPEVSKEQFYKVSDTLKEAIAQPNTFSLRSLFGNNETIAEESIIEDQNYIALDAGKKPKVKNPLETKERNPFVYDSSESENEDEPDAPTDAAPVAGETKAVWKENLFFSNADLRLKDGLAFFNSSEEAQKERRELKSLVKKRIYNKERKNQMFQKKIGGRRKTMKKSFRKKT